MAAGINDYFTHVGEPGNSTFLAAPGHTIGGTSWTVDSTGLWPTDTAVIFAVDTVAIVGTETERVAGSYTVWRGLVTSATNIGSTVLMYGTDQNYAASSSTRVYILPTSSRENRLIDGLLLHLFDQDGTMKAGAVDNAAALASNVVTTAKILAANVTMPKIAFSGAKVKKSAVQTLTSGAGTDLTWDQEDYDTDSYHDNSSNPSRLTIAATGYYTIGATINFASWSSGSAGSRFIIILKKNGSTLIELFDSDVWAASEPTITVTHDCALTAADYIEVNVLQGTSVSRNVSTDSRFWVKWNGV